MLLTEHSSNYFFKFAAELLMLFKLISLLMQSRLFLLVTALIFHINVVGKTFKVYSPNRNDYIEIKYSQNDINVNIFKTDVKVAGSIKPGLVIDDLPFNRFKIVGKKKFRFSETWNPVWGKQSEIINQYNEIIIRVRDFKNMNREMNIIFRVYDNGVALRYEIPEQESINSFIINNDLTSFEVEGNSSFWCPNGENPNIGPVNVLEAAEKFQGRNNFQTPMVFDMGESCYLAVHEAATFDFSYSLLRPAGRNRFQFEMESSKGKTPAKTSWRVFMTGDRVGDLLESNLLYNLNPPCAIQDPSWIKPGVSLWDWRTHGAKAGSFTYDINQESYLRFIDFAGRHRIDYVLFDAGWYSAKGPTFSRDGMDMPELIRYAERKGVGILLYIDRRRNAWGSDNEKAVNDWNLEDVLKTWSKWGVKGIKYGFLRSECSGRQELVKKTREIVELCAGYKMLIDFHDQPVPPSGDSRTWPNLITREYCHAQSDALKAFKPETFITAVTVNGISGSLDMNNGYFELNSLMGRKKIGEPILSTVVSEVARPFIVFSGLIIIPDHPDAYMAKNDLFEFVKNIEGSWDETIVLNAEIGKYITVARRKGDTWMMGAATNEEARELNIDLDFLDNGNYEFTIFSDGQEASAFGNKEDYQVHKKYISSDEKYTYSMAPGGGHCVIIRKITN
jgi:hypothetical protein